MNTSSDFTVALLDDYQDAAPRFADWHALKGKANVVSFRDHVTDSDALAARLAPFDAIVLIRERTQITAALLARLPRLKLIVTIGNWNAAIDLAAAHAHGVTVCGTTAGDEYATPAMTWGLILAATRDIVGQVNSVRSKGWQTTVGVDLTGKTLGVLGLGRIGQTVAKIGTAFGMKLIAWSQNLTEEAARGHNVQRVDKDELFARADVLTIHLKLSERTHHLVTQRELGLMKPSAFLVNTSRGPIVSETALIEALQQKRIAGAALDVFDTEPLPIDHPFRWLPNVLATPHIGYVTEHTYRNAYPQIVEAIQAYLNGKPIRELVAR